MGINTIGIFPLRGSPPCCFTSPACLPATRCCASARSPGNHRLGGRQDHCRLPVGQGQAQSAIARGHHPLAKEIGTAMIERLWNNPRFMSAALPHKVFPPLVNCYREGGSFGFHIDNAVRQPRGSIERVRTDLSSTLFFSDPEDYDGGELEIEDTYGLQQVKLAAGDMVLYPGTESAQGQPGDPWRPLRGVLLDAEHDSRGQPAHPAVRDGQRDPATSDRRCARSPVADQLTGTCNTVAPLGRGRPA